MILVRQVFQVKYGYMDKVLEMMKAMGDQMPTGQSGWRVLTDISGRNFTLVIESKAESVDAYWRGLQEMFKDAPPSTEPDPMSQYIEYGDREFYTIESETGSF